MHSHATDRFSNIMSSAQLSEKEIVAILETAYTGAVYDAVRELGHSNCTLPPEIRPIDASTKLVGKVWTCSGAISDNVSQDDSLLSWTGMLSAAPAGSVVVCQPNDSTIAHMGELSAETLKFRGVKGYIVDGGNRDTDFILRLGFPVFCRYLTPSDIVARWVVETMGKPIVIGDASVRTGDFVIGDRDGVVIVPSAMASAVALHVQDVMNTENELRAMILSGMDPQQAYLKYRRF